MLANTEEDNWRLGSSDAGDRREINAKRLFCSLLRRNGTPTLCVSIHFCHDDRAKVRALLKSFCLSFCSLSCKNVKLVEIYGHIG